jgi:anti-sigma B factor antagonist
MNSAPNIWQEDGIWFISVKGRLDHDTTPQLGATLFDVLDKGHYCLVVDLSDTTYINSGGLRVLLSAWRRARQQQGDLNLCGLNERLTEIFEMAGFDRVFRIYATRVDAQDAFSQLLND